MSITAEQVSKLRARTGSGILDAKNALEEAKGDEEIAIDILRKKGKAQAIKKADRAQSEGGVFIATSDSKAAIVQVKCETDFVGRSDVFVNFGQDLANNLLSNSRSSFDAYAAEKVPAAVLELGENISLGEVKEVSAPVVGSYVHSNRKIGVVVGLEGGTTEQAADVAMHGAAMNPLYVSPSDVSQEVILKEREIWKEQLSKENKPAEIQEKIMLGKEKKFREENALLTQSFVKNQDQTVEKMLGTAKLKEYLRVSF